MCNLQDLSLEMEASQYGIDVPDTGVRFAVYGVLAAVLPSMCMFLLLQRSNPLTHVGIAGSSSYI